MGSERGVSGGARDVNVGCRNGFEASWRDGRGTLKGGTRTRRTAKEKATDPDGTGSHSRRGKGAPGEQRPKGRREPLDQVSGRPVGHRSSSEVESVEGAWGPVAEER